jgi:ketosteroid isomerase-like protein
VATDETGVREQTLQLAHSYQSLLSQQRFDEWIELWAEDGTCEFPFAHESRRRIYQGKREILAYMAATPGRIAIDALAEMRVHPMLDPEVATVEFAISGRVLTTGRPYNQRYVAFLEAKNGKIWRYREYWNPVVSMEAYGGLDAWLSADTETPCGEVS